MSVNIFIFFLSYLLIFFAIIGFGYFFVIFFYRDINYFNIGYVGLFGCLILILYSYVSNFFIPHEIYHNFALIIIGIFLFIYFNYKKKFFKVLEFRILIIYFLVLFVSFLVFKTHEDFPYYHFPYTHYLTQNKLIIGLGNYDLGFRTPSSIFYLGSLFYFPIIQFYMFLMPIVLLMGFSNIIFINKIYEDFKITKINFLTFFSLLSFIFVNIFFYRIAAHGTDRSAQILVFVLILEVLCFINYPKNLNNYISKKISKIFILLALIITLKAFYILYLIFLVPLIYYFYQNYKFNNFFKYLVFNVGSILLLLTFLIVIFKNFLITGCLIYPLEFTCFENFSWALPKKEIERLYNHYQLWSKAGMGPNYIVDNPESYIKSFNWLKFWFNNYFFTKVSDFLFGLFLILVITNIIFFSKLKKNNVKNKNIFFSLVILLLLFFEWFYHHPDLRYGGYCIIAAIFFIFFSVKFEKYKINSKILYKKFCLLILCGLMILVFRNVVRISEEMKIYNYQPIRHSGFMFEETHYLRANKYFTLLIENYNKCKQNIFECNTNLEKKIKYKNYMYILLK